MPVLSISLKEIYAHCELEGPRVVQPSVRNTLSSTYLHRYHRALRMGNVVLHETEKSKVTFLLLSVLKGGYAL